MGLDSYAYKVPKEYVKNDFEIKDYAYICNDESNELAYWRKHYELHNWFKALYLKKGGKDDSFNLTPIRVTVEDLNKLQWAFKKNKSLHYSNYMQWDYKETDDEFIKNALQAIEDGYEVFFESWY